MRPSHADVLRLVTSDKPKNVCVGRYGECERNNIPYTSEGVNNVLIDIC